ncbi:hypothetical protein [Actinomadura madurae]|nr:hypothetical protein [Actinomadura madurae]MCP9947268.1 hypothetical protein [Actinomadura madurae]MCP9964031.1 hypothetical protein [Actinomadura madurae]MCP9976504.1 hypothetical protein [Actinomadura madurae]MCQ0011999.1 hypothetical protein [Actinomadura madurae]MCQ0012700.1 hypothetical protein [Actinomadura madurae]
MMWLAGLILAVIALVWAVADRAWQLALLSAAVVLLALSHVSGIADWGP